MDAAITSIAPWFGGKRSLAPEVVRELGRHTSYYEPFCGSLAVLFAKEPSTMETVNDLHGDLVTLACVVASDSAPELYDRLSRTLCCEAIFKTATEMLDEPLDPPASPLCVDERHIARAYWFFIQSWMGRNGISGLVRQSWQMAVRWTQGGGQGATRFTNSVESIPAWHQRLKKVLILCRDAFQIIERVEDEAGTAIYLDPPYLAETRTGSNGSRYLHDFTDADHVRLAELASRFERARVVISYYEDPRLAELYPTDKWTHRAVYRQKNLHVQNRRGQGQTLAPEVLLLNGPSYAEAAARRLF